LGVFLAAGAARATERADYFTSAPTPSIEFDRGSMTWTLGNAAVSRAIRYDRKTGSLRTLRFSGAGFALKPVPGGEGVLSFTAPFIGVPKPLTNWKMTDSAPAPDWNQFQFQDKEWQSVKLPFRTEETGKTYWFRCILPPGSMDDKHGYGLLFDKAIGGDAEIYVDGQLMDQVDISRRPAERAFHIDLLPKNQVVAIKLTTRGAVRGLPGLICLGEVGSAPPSLNLDSDWQYMTHSVNAGEDGSKVLIITLSGVRKHDGLDMDVCYQVYPGNVPIIAKWFSFINHRSTRYLVEKVVYDQWQLPTEDAQVQPFLGSGTAAASPTARRGLLTAVLSPLGGSEPGLEEKSLAPTLRSHVLARTDVAIQFPKSLTALYRGTTATGAFLYQAYIGQFRARASAASVPPVFSTRYAYGDAISAEMCEKIIPIAASLGLKVFLLDDGWQTNALPKSGKYGDWVVDRSENKFRNGLGPISLRAREQKMQFGLQIYPTRVSDTSQVASEKPDWLIRGPGGERYGLGEDTAAMCFISGWAETFTRSMQLLCRELSVTYLQMDGPMLIDGCSMLMHEHPVGHSIQAQSDHWKDFTDTMRKLDPLTPFLFNRGTDTWPEQTAFHDTGGFANWRIVADPNGRAEPSLWYRNADAVRHDLYDLLWTRPAFTLSASAPCHLPAATPDLNALEYHLVSAAATVGNLEICGRLDQMTPEEAQIVGKWVQWNQENRPWLAYTQPLGALGKPYDPADTNATPKVDGVLHLRPALKGRYGYLCLWNPGSQAERTTVAFNPADYFVNLSGLRVVRLKDSKPARFEMQGGAVSLSLSLEPRSWEIYELRQ
jgi:hypothetical protein